MQGPTGTNEEDPPQPPKLPSSGPWTSWSSVPVNVAEIAAAGPWFLEVFSGTARLTEAMRQCGIPCLPPIDITVCQSVPVAFDVVDSDRWDFVMQLIYAGAVVFIHFGTPCNTFSAARKDDGGPPPLRSQEFPDGLPSLQGVWQDHLFLGNLFKDRTFEACLALVLTGGNFSIENPLLSLIWETDQFKFLFRHSRAFFVDFDQCAFGAPSMKPTRMMITHERLVQSLKRNCPGNHRHEVLKGKVFSAQFGRVVYRTKLAQVYPFDMCMAIAKAVQHVWSSPFEHLERSFRLQGDLHDRKRPVGQITPWKPHRQASSAQAAVESGYQLKRGALKPLLQWEMMPGQAIEWVLQTPHPFTVMEGLPSTLDQAINAVAISPAQVRAHRQRLLEHWGTIALEALRLSDRILLALPDAALRRLLRGVPDDQPAKLGTTCNVELYRIMLQHVKSVDQTLPSLLVSGFPIVGPIRKSGRWPSLDPTEAATSLEELQGRAWAIRKKIVHRVTGVPVSDNLFKLWEATLEDVSDGSCMGPFYTYEQVDHAVGCDDWIPTQRFEVVQKNNVRGCDSATTNLINPATVITEKLQLPSTDTNVAALRALRSACPMDKLAGWVLDEKKAYRQVAIDPKHRKFSVIALKDPQKGVPAFFVMVGHSFGLVSAVYNYNRRSAAINEILTSLFGLVAFSFYDDKYGFEPRSTVESAHQVAQSVHWWLGAHFDQKKLQLSDSPTILGVTYNLSEMVLEIKESRKKELIEELDSIVNTKLLDPGSAGKLKGKLMFGASQLWGKVGRAFLRPFSERQYAKFPVGDQFSLDEALLVSIKHWKFLIESGPPRPIDFKCKKVSDLVIFTDGFTPDPRKKENLPDRVGAVAFDHRMMAPIQFSEVVPKSVQKRWLVRKTQIVPVEMIAPILALQTFRDRAIGADVIILIDSEAVEASLIKGYSSKEDLRSLISVFWDTVFELRARVFLDRVATDANPADWPSRADLASGEAAGWRTVKAVWPEALFN